MKIILRYLGSVFAASVLVTPASWCEVNIGYQIAQPHRTRTDLSTQAAIEANTAALNRKVVHIRAENLPASTVFLAIADKAGMRVGVELTGSDDSAKPVSVDTSTGIVMDAFDRLYFASNQEYTRSGGGGYDNYYPQKHRIRDVRELGDKSPAYVPPPYVFTTMLEHVKFDRKSPEQALSDLLAREDVRDKPPALPIAVVPSGLTFTDKELTFGERNIRVRHLVNIVAAVAGKSWIAYVNEDSKGKKSLKVRFFEKASEVCPDVSKVTVELE